MTAVLGPSPIERHVKGREATGRVGQAGGRGGKVSRKVWGSLGTYMQSWRDELWGSEWTGVGKDSSPRQPGQGLRRPEAPGKEGHLSSPEQSHEAGGYTWGTGGRWGPHREGPFTPKNFYTSSSRQHGPHTFLHKS